MNPIDAGELAAALPAANLAVLVAAVTHLTGDFSVIDAHPEPRTFDHGRGPGRHQRRCGSCGGHRRRCESDGGCSSRMRG